MFGAETVREAGWSVVRGRAVRVLLFALAVWAGLSFATVARAQISSVRQAKLVTTDANGNPVLNDQAVSNASGTSSRSFDTTAFSSAVVSLTQVSGTCNFSGAVVTYEIPETYGWIRLRWAWNAGTTSLTIFAETAASQSATFGTMVAPNAAMTLISVQSSCVFDASLLLIPFSSTVISTGLVPDGARAPGTNGVTYPVLSAGVEDTADGPIVHTLRTNSSYALIVTGTVTPVTPTLATEDPIVPNSVTTSETVYSFDGTKRVTLSNTGTGALLCTVTTNSSLTVTTSNYTISLAAASIADNGTGSTITLPYVPASGTYLRCIALSGTAIAVGFAHP